MVDDRRETTLISLHNLRKRRVDEAIDAAFGLVPRDRQPGAAHGRDGERDHRGDQDRAGERTGKTRAGSVHQSVHEQQRHKDGDQRQRDGNDGEGDLAGADDRRLERTLALARTLSMFSIITMASSTTNPTETVSAINDRLSIE